MSDYLTIAVNADAHNISVVEDVFQDFGSLSITLENAERTDSPRIEPSEWRVTRLTALMPSTVELHDIRQTLAGLGIEDLAVNTITEQDWLANLHQPVVDRSIGQFVVGENPKIEDSSRIPLKLNAGMAFGTGEHETTAMCLEWLAKQRVMGARVLDVGCGTGILAIAAAKLGAETVTAIDNDPIAIEVAAKNACNNDVAIDLDIRLEPTMAFDIVVANVYASELIKLVPTIQSSLAVRGAIALSGVLSSQSTQVIETYSLIQFDEPEERNGWVLLTGIKHSHPKR